MIRENAFTVSASSDRVFDVLANLRRTFPCVPHTRIVGGLDDQNVQAELRVRLGRTSVDYRGTVRIIDSDREAGAIALDVAGEEHRGSGRVRGIVHIRLREARGSTTVAMHLDLSATGRVSKLPEADAEQAVQDLLSGFAAGLSAQVAAELLETPGAEEAQLQGVADAGEAPAAAAEAPVPAGVAAASAEVEAGMLPRAEHGDNGFSPAAGPEDLLRGAANDGAAASETGAEASGEQTGASAPNATSGEAPDDPEPDLVVPPQPEEPPPVRGTVQLMSEEPLEVPRAAGLESVGNGLRAEIQRRPWIIPATLLGVLALILLLRRRDR